MLTGRRADRGSVLVLMPAAVLTVVMLAAVAVDLSLVFLRQRQASSYAVDLANDLTTMGLDAAAFRADGEYVLMGDRELTALAHERIAPLLGDELASVRARRIAPATVEVRIVLRADYLFARALPGDADRALVTGVATAEAASS